MTTKQPTTPTVSKETILSMKLDDSFRRSLVHQRDWKYSLTAPMRARKDIEARVNSGWELIGVATESRKKFQVWRTR